MNTQITHKLIAVVIAVLMNGVVLGSVDYLFGTPAASTSPQTVRQNGDLTERGIA